MNGGFPRECVVGQVVFRESFWELGEKCEAEDGNWLSEFRECEGISRKNCWDLDGVYYECESACRNDPDAEFCIMMCVQVCKFE